RSSIRNLPSEIYCNEPCAATIGRFTQNAEDPVPAQRLAGLSSASCWREDQNVMSVVFLGIRNRHRNEAITQFEGSQRIRIGEESELVTVIHVFTAAHHGVIEVVNTAQ